MKRYWFLLILAAVLAALLTSEQIVIRTFSGHTEALVKTAMEQIDRDDCAAAEQTLCAARDYWNEKKRILEAISEQSAAEQISIDLDEAITHLHSGEETHGAVCCTDLLHRIGVMQNLQQLSFYNLF